VKVLDFGGACADFEHREAETCQMFFGSLPYMAPERHEFEDSHAGDVYALGAVLYELLTGELFGETSSDDVEHQEHLGARLRRLQAEPDLSRLLERMLAYETRDRPTAREVERAGRLLRQRIDDPWLSDFAARIIPPMLSEREIEGDEWTGAVLREESLTHAWGRTPSLVLGGAVFVGTLLLLSLLAFSVARVAL
jgi:serine/threonine protein kinase